ncbi:hypothetical protein FRC15_011313 [Serendipita sp. 397]|nr:hypothetical protein FRC15_011313 [Serendipita sp. 397]
MILMSEFYLPFLHLDREDTEYPIPLPNITSPVLKKVLEYCEHHQADPLPTIQVDGGPRRRTNISKWDQQFINVDQDMRFDILLAAWHLDIKSLVYVLFFFTSDSVAYMFWCRDVGCQTVANQMKGKSPEELRKFFNLANDFTPEEEVCGISLVSKAILLVCDKDFQAQIRKEKEWANDR